MRLILWNRLVMKRLLCSLLGVWAAATVAAAATTNLTFHVQLIRGTESDSPPSKDSKGIGPKLAANFRRVFTWKQFWEVDYQEVHLAPGKKTKLRLSPEREVEIDLNKPGQRIVTAFSKGKLVTRAIDPLDAPMTLIGSERDAHSVWFIAVRRDKPSTD
jgi:hypothetical protein